MIARVPLRLAHSLQHSSPTTITGTITTLPTQYQQQVQRRSLHRRIIQPPVPKPTPFVPDATTFLTLIGRNLRTHASKIQSWDALFTLTSPQLKDLGVEPPRARRYLLRWRDKFRNGEFGIGGDLTQVGEDGTAEVRCVEVPWDARIGKGVVRSSLSQQQRRRKIAAEGAADASAKKTVKHAPAATLTRSPGMKKVIVNVPAEEPVAGQLAGQALKSATSVQGLKQMGASTIYGPGIQLIKGSGGSRAVIKAKEGLWEHVRGHKIDGGERRKAEVRAKRRSAERKAGRA